MKVVLSKIRATSPEPPGPSALASQVFQWPSLQGATHKPKQAPLAPNTRSLLAVRAAPELRGPVDGLAFCRAAIAQIRKIKALNPAQRCAVLFDLDNTLFDTRARTLHALQQFDAAHQTEHFQGLRLQDMAWNGEETAQALGLPASVVSAAQSAWAQHFWSGENFLRDENIAEVQALAHEAAEAGAEVFYLTGRIDALGDASAAQVEQAGLPFADVDHVLSKPEISTQTGPFKAQALQAFLQEGAFLGFFVTDNKQEILDIHEADPRLPAVHYAHALQRSGTLRADTPVIDSPA